jgi:hypothetical protein
MGMTIHVQANTAEEWTAMESEGAPSLHVSYSRAAELFDLFGVRPDDDDCYCGTIDPDDILSSRDEALAKAGRMPDDWVLTAGGGEWLNVYVDYADVLVRMAEVARNLGRPIGFG